MTSLRLLLIAVLSVLSLSACKNVADLLQPNKDLSSGIKSYEDGDYKDAMVSLQKAQNPNTSNKTDQVTAHKYLAFIHCISGREEQCRTEFRKALTIDPSFDLKKAEAGHPVWGPVFRGEKAKFTQ